MSNFGSNQGENLPTDQDSDDAMLDFNSGDMTGNLFDNNTTVLTNTVNVARANLEADYD